MFFRYFSIVIFLAAPICIVGCNDSDNALVGTKAGDPTILPVNVVPVVRRDEYSYPMQFYGRIRSARESALSFELNGLVAKIQVDEGDQISRGQPLATIDTEILAAQKQLLLANKSVEESLLRRLRTGEREEVVAAARAAVERMEADAQQAFSKLQREKKLVGNKSIPAAQYEQSTYKFESLAAALKEGRERLKEIESGTREEDIDAQQKRVAIQDAEIAILDTRIKKATLYAPFDGQVIERIIDDGTVLEAGQPVLVVSDSKKREARFSLPIAQLNQVARVRSVRLGRAEIPVDNVRTVLSVDRNTRTVDVVFELGSTSGLIAGETCVLTLSKTVKSNCVELSVSALVPSIRGLWSCYCIEKKSGSDSYVVVKHEVTVEHTDGDRVFVETSLPDDALIVSEGVQKLVPGMIVRPMGENR